jgi:hypothetical protein
MSLQGGGRKDKQWNQLKEQYPKVMGVESWRLSTKYKKILV